LADQPLMEAAKSVRDERDRTTDVRSLFLKAGNEHVRAGGEEKKARGSGLRT
jgi:hypothetical protein